MALEKPTPPPIPRATGRPERKTQEILPKPKEEVLGIIDQARTLLKERIANPETYLEQPVPQHPDQLKLGVRIELSRIRKGKPMMSYDKDTKLEDMMDFELRKAGIREAVDEARKDIGL